LYNSRGVMHLDTDTTAAGVLCKMAALHLLSEPLMEKRETNPVTPAVPIVLLVR
jgi:hypothetical protein